MKQKNNKGFIIKEGKEYGFYPDGSLYRIYDRDRPLLQIIDKNGATFLRVRQNTEKGFEDCPVNSPVNISYPSSVTKRGRVIRQGKLIGALTCTMTFAILMEL